MFFLGCSHRDTPQGTSSFFSFCAERPRGTARPQPGCSCPHQPCRLPPGPSASPPHPSPPRGTPPRGSPAPPRDVGWKPRPRLPPARGLTFSRRFRAAAAAGNNGGCCLCVSLPHCLQYGDLPLNYIFILSAILAAYMTPQPSRPSPGSSTAQIPSLFLPLRGNPGLWSLKIGPAYSFPSFFFAFLLTPETCLAHPSAVDFGGRPALLRARSRCGFVDKKAELFFIFFELFFFFSCMQISGPWRGGARAEAVCEAAAGRRAPGPHKSLTAEEKKHLNFFPSPEVSLLSRAGGGEPRWGRGCSTVATGLVAGAKRAQAERGNGVEEGAGRVKQLELGRTEDSSLGEIFF